ncbi:MAG TPA: HD-GYP domain-containing protein [Desulfitobacteriaceae bacterium]|jgi:HD-GYP domain-containing protein (c-di-GMP phosphodiesterase class II)|nr:HD-GYP domain-containing protein [Desulfitobacteriaceae bacterium]
MCNTERYLYLDKIHSKDPITGQHCGKAAEYAVCLGQKLDLTTEEIEQLNEAALLHDIGKIKVPDAILFKPSALTDEEYEVIKCHSIWGADIIEDGVPEDRQWKDVVIEIIRHHHERYDGKGYPEGLPGEKIPFFAQIISIVDAFDAMTSDRPYRSAMLVSEAKRILLEERGKQFHPWLVDQFVDIPVDDT